jgi:hypothetical protein
MAYPRWRQAAHGGRGQGGRLASGDEQGWWDMPPLAEWKCPDCGQASPVGEWAECEPGCEDCGSHDGRECQRCGEWFDHVFGIRRLLEANPTYHLEGRPADGEPG